MLTNVDHRENAVQTHNYFLRLLKRSKIECERVLKNPSRPYLSTVLHGPNFAPKHFDNMRGRCLLRFVNRVIIAARVTSRF